MAAFRIEPDLAFALEGTVCDDTPKKQDVSPTTELGKGPAITIMDRSFIADGRLLEMLIDTAGHRASPTNSNSRVWAAPMPERSTSAKRCANGRGRGPLSLYPLPREPAEPERLGAPGGSDESYSAGPSGKVGIGALGLIPGAPWCYSKEKPCENADQETDRSLRSLRS